MQIKNYTSSVAVEKTIANIERRLAEAGVNGISKNYGPTGQVACLIFAIDLNKQHFKIRIPVNVDDCFEALVKEHKRTHPRLHEKTQLRLRDQAARTAWRIIEEWILIQLSMIIMKQAEWLEVFLPYIWDGQNTVFGKIKDSGFKSLPEHT